MSINSQIDLAKRYTDETYATKDEVKKGLNMSLIDLLWSRILGYRSQFEENLILRDSKTLVFFYCNIQSIKEKMTKLINQIHKCKTNFAALDDEDKKKTQFKLFNKSLAYIGQRYGETFTTEFISSVINGTTKNSQGANVTSEAKAKAINYFDTLKILNDTTLQIDQDSLFRIYSSISKKENIVSLYRTFDFVNDGTRATGLYGVANERIEKMMNNLFIFASDNKYPTLIKASIVYFYINYVMPFDDFNEEIATLLFKIIIGNDVTTAFANLFPVESFMINSKQFASAYKEIVRGNDTTYVLVRVLDLLPEIIDFVLDSCVNEQIASLERDHFSSLEINQLKQESVSDAPKTTENVEPIKTKPAEIAIPVVQQGIDEKEAHKFEKYLLERDPELKETQAHFYARHCTLGSYYTIQNFKKAERVVYETARTSMEALTKLGYYEKRQIKNKFVYTPVKQGK